jgi:hypothetical protein
MTSFGSVLAGLIALTTVLMGARYLVDPQPAAAGFGIPSEPGEAVRPPAWLAVKASRDIAIGIAIAALLIGGAHRALGCLLLATALIPFADGVIVLRAGGPRATAYGVHWLTAALFAADGVLLLL